MMLRRAREKCERTLYRMGFASDSVRRALSRQFLVAGVAVLIGALALPFSSWPATFALGAILASVNFFFLARSIEKTITLARLGGVSAGLFGFLARFGAMAGALALCLFWFETPVIPLVAGLSTVVAGNAAAGVSRSFRHSHKEA